MKCSINKKYYFLLLILLFAGGLPAKSSNLDKTKPEDIIRLASYNIRTKGDKGDKAWEVRLNALVDVVRRNKFDMFAIQEGRTSQLKDMMILNEYSYIGRDRDGDNKGEHCAIYYKKDRFKVLKHGDFWYSETPDIPSMVGEHVVAGFALGDILKTSGPGRNSMCLIRIRIMKQQKQDGNLRSCCWNR